MCSGHHWQQNPKPTQTLSMWQCSPTLCRCSGGWQYPFFRSLLTSYQHEVELSLRFVYLLEAEGSGDCLMVSTECVISLTPLLGLTAPLVVGCGRSGVVGCGLSGLIRPPFVWLLLRIRLSPRKVSSVTLLDSTGEGDRPLRSGFAVDKQNTFHFREDYSHINNLLL